MFKRRSEMTDRERIISVSLIIIICLTLLFIFFQSILPPAASKEESDSVAGILSLIFPRDSFIIKNIREIAHFLEYGLLGVEISLYVCFFACKPFAASAASFASALLVATIDEIIQIFSGRVADILDVCTDFSGFVTLSIITYAVCFFIFPKKKRNL